MELFGGWSHWIIFAIAVVSVARTARLITHDTFPPIEWARPRIAARLGKWADLVICPFCIAPYLTAVQLVWLTQLWGTDAFTWGWLIPNAWWALSYLSAIVVAWDQPE